MIGYVNFYIECNNKLLQWQHDSEHGNVVRLLVTFYTFGNLKINKNKTKVSRLETEK